jgi:RNA polymerase sigma-70 factor (ECF subfamily)
MDRRLTEIEDLIAQIALRDRAAFAALYDRTSAKLFGICLRILGDRAEAEDALQEVYLRIWDNANRYAVNGLSPMTWLITVARNRAIDRLRARRAPTQDIADLPDLADAGPTPEQAAVASATRTQIDTCMDELPAERADAVRRAYLDGETYQDLAARHGVPLNTMRTWLRRSLLKLRECLSR